MLFSEVIAKPSGFAGYANFRPHFSRICRQDARAPRGLVITSSVTKSVRSENNIYGSYRNIALPFQGGDVYLPKPRATALVRLCPGLLCAGLSARILMHSSV